MKLCWLDIRATSPDIREAVLTEAVHQRIDGIVASDPADLAGLPPTITKILLPPPGREELRPRLADIVILPPGHETRRPAESCPGTEFGRFVEIVDAPTLGAACASAREERWSVLRFRDPTKIPLEIVIAAASGAAGKIITVVADPQEAAVVFGVLQHGPAGALMAAKAVGDATALKRAAAPPGSHGGLEELEVTAVTHGGMGERACIDTCSYLGKDEGILAGSHSKGMLLCASETHP